MRFVRRTQAAGVFAGTRAGLAGRIGRTVLASLMPDRRLRIIPRADRTTDQATIDIAVLASDLTPDDEP